MEFLADLWAPISLSAVLVFIASSLIHMVLQIHKSDYKKLPREEEVLASLRALAVPPGEYVFPHCSSMKEMGSPETQEKFRKGPVGLIIVRPSGMPAMGKPLFQWFLFCVVVSVFAAYVGSLALAPGAEYMRVFRITGTVAVLAYSVSNVTNSIWKGSTWSSTLKYVFDGVVYGLLTAGSFAWLWPSA